jgi:hypothetical protein
LQTTRCQTIRYAVNFGIQLPVGPALIIASQCFVLRPCRDCLREHRIKRRWSNREAAQRTVTEVCLGARIGQGDVMTPIDHAENRERESFMKIS